MKTAAGISRLHALDIVCREDTAAAVQLALPPIGRVRADNRDDVILLNAELVVLAGARVERVPVNMSATSIDQSNCVQSNKLALVAASVVLRRGGRHRNRVLRGGLVGLLVLVLVAARADDKEEDDQEDDQQHKEAREDGDKRNLPRGKAG